MNRTRPIKLAIAALGCLMLAGLSAAPAQAELVGEFNARLKNIKLDYGGYTAVFDSRVYDTTGAPPPMLQSAQIQFPRGASIRPEFLRGGFFCDTAKLEQSSDPASCASSRFASGDILLDARPSITTAIPSSIFLFLAPPARGRRDRDGRRAGGVEREDPGLLVAGALRQPVSPTRAASATGWCCRPRSSPWCPACS